MDTLVRNEIPERQTATEVAPQIEPTVTEADTLSTIQQPLPQDNDISPGVSTIIETASTETHIAGAARKLNTFLEKSGVDPDTIFSVRLAFVEAVSNAVIHGNGADPSKCVSAKCSASDKRIDLCVTDEGCGFDCTGAMKSLADPLRDRSRGLHLMNALMDTVYYNDTGNVVTMKKSILVATPEEQGRDRQSEIIQNTGETTM